MIPVAWLIPLGLTVLLGLVVSLTRVAVAADVPMGRGQPGGVRLSWLGLGWQAPLTAGTGTSWLRRMSGAGRRSGLLQRMVDVPHGPGLRRCLGYVRRRWHWRRLAVAVALGTGDAMETSLLCPAVATVLATGLGMVLPRVGIPYTALSLQVAPDFGRAGVSARISVRFSVPVYALMVCAWTLWRHRRRRPRAFPHTRDQTRVV